MATHSRLINGPMLQHTITTTGATKQEEHDAKVNAFNTEHDVWYNSSDCKVIPTGTTATIVWVTFCLYTPKLN